MLVRLLVGLVTAVLAVVATVLIVVVFPPALVVFLLGAAVALAWWSISEFRHGRTGFRSILAGASVSTLVAAALCAAFAFAPVSGPSFHGPVHPAHKLSHS